MTIPMIRFYAHSCPVCGPEGEMLIAKKSDGSLCFQCAECQWVCDREEDLPDLERGHRPNEGMLAAPTIDEIEAAGWARFCVNGMTEEDEHLVLRLRLLVLLTAPAVGLSDLCSLMPGDWKRQPIGKCLLLSGGDTWILAQEQQEPKRLTRMSQYDSISTTLGALRGCLLIFYESDHAIATLLRCLTAVQLLCADMENDEILDAAGVLSKLEPPDSRLA